MRLEHRVSRRALLTTAAVAAASAVVGRSALAAVPADALPPVTVYKDPNCGCCKAWMTHMQKSGFVLTAHDTADMGTIKAQMGVKERYASCHTALVGRYVIEGHVGADLVKRLLKEKPDALGLAVPGMPIGSPGMEGGTPDRYDVLLLLKGGGSRVYASR